MKSAGQHCSFAWIVLNYTPLMKSTEECHTLFRIPDKPGSTILPWFLDKLDERLYFATLKYDGWRCIIKRVGRKFTYTSRTNKPILIPADIREEFESSVPFDCDMEIDSELLGRRRTGDVAGIKVLDTLSFNGDNWRGWSNQDRFDQTVALFPDKVVEFSLSKFTDFFNHHKEFSPMAEGIVLRSLKGKRVDPVGSQHKNNGMIKCKWRDGQDGLAPTEL